jgi:hypothetical protein
MLFGSGEVLEVVDGRRTVREVVEGWKEEGKAFAGNAGRYRLY